VSDTNGMGAGAEPSPRPWVSGSKIGSAKWQGFGSSSTYPKLKNQVDPHEWNIQSVRAVQSKVLREADEIVNGDRQDTYGHPLDNHGCTAELWTAYLNRKYDLDFDLDARDVCFLNILQKISREANFEKKDNLVDIVGYIANIEIIDDI